MCGLWLKPHFLGYCPTQFPQGSVLTPLLFILYTADIGAIFQLFGVSSHQFTNNAQALHRGPASSAIQTDDRILDASSALDQSILLMLLFSTDYTIALLFVLA